MMVLAQNCCNFWELHSFTLVTEKLLNGALVATPTPLDP